MDHATSEEFPTKKVYTMDKYGEFAERVRESLDNQPG